MPQKQITFVGVRPGIGTTTAVTLLAAINDAVIVHRSYESANIASGGTHENRTGKPAYLTIDIGRATYGDGNATYRLVDGGSIGNESGFIGDDVDHRERWLVVANDYYSLKMAQDCDLESFQGMVVISEDGRALRENDIFGAVGEIPIKATIKRDPSIGRACDAGFLASRFCADYKKSVRNQIGIEKLVSARLGPIRSNEKVAS